MPRGHYLAEAVKDAIWVLRADGMRRCGTSGGGALTG